MERLDDARADGDASGFAERGIPAPLLRPADVQCFCKAMTPDAFVTGSCFESSLFRLYHSDINCTGTRAVRLNRSRRGRIEIQSVHRVQESVETERLADVLAGGRPHLTAAALVAHEAK